MPIEVFHSDLKAAIAAHRKRFSSPAVLMPLDSDSVNIPDGDLDMLGGLWVPAGSLDSQVARFVADIDTVKPGGIIRIFEAEANPVFWNHPEIVEAIFRAARPEEALLRHYNRGTEMLTQGRMDDAVYDYGYCERLVDRLQITPESLVRFAKGPSNFLVDLLGNTFNNFGFVLMVGGKVEDARLRLQRALEFNPVQINANNNLGDCYKLLGNSELAKGHYARELQVNPAHPTAKISLAAL